MLWSEDLLAFDPDARVQTVSVGEAGKVVLIDGFYAHPERVLEVAQGLFYSSGAMHGNFPGARAMVTLDTRVLLEKLSKAWGTPLEPFNQPFLPAIFSKITPAGMQLNEGQRQPHIDPGVSAMVYLNPDDECLGGTGIYRQKLIGIERIPEKVDATILQLAKKFGYPASLQSPGDYQRFQDAMFFNPMFAAKGNTYVNDGNEYWELLYLIEMKFNRLVIFDGRMPHSQYIQPGQFDDRPRLNQIMYLRAKA